MTLTAATAAEVDDLAELFDAAAGLLERKQADCKRPATRGVWSIGSRDCPCRRAITAERLRGLALDVRLGRTLR